MRQDRVGVVEVGDHDNPVVDLSPRYAIVYEHGPCAVLAACPPHQAKTGQHADIGSHDVLVVRRVEDDRPSCRHERVSIAIIRGAGRPTGKVIRPLWILHLTRNIVHWVQT